MATDFRIATPDLSEVRPAGPVADQSYGVRLCGLWSMRRHRPPAHVPVTSAQPGFATLKGVPRELGGEGLTGDASEARRDT